MPKTKKKDKKASSFPDKKSKMNDVHPIAKKTRTKVEVSPRDRAE